MTDTEILHVKIRDILRGADKEVYIKDDLAKTAPWFPFKSEERDADLHTVKWDGGNHG